MIMKKLIVLLIAAIVSVGSMYAQDYDERAKLREERRCRTRTYRLIKL